MELSKYLNQKKKNWIYIILVEEKYKASNIYFNIRKYLKQNLKKKFCDMIESSNINKLKKEINILLRFHSS